VLTPVLTRRGDKRGATPAIKRCPCSLPPRALVLHGQHPGKAPSPSQLRPFAAHKPSHDSLGQLVVPRQPQPNLCHTAARLAAATAAGRRCAPSPATSQTRPTPGVEPLGVGTLSPPFPSRKRGRARRTARTTTPEDHIARIPFFPMT
jgi:hypothetical protein